MQFNVLLTFWCLKMFSTCSCNVLKVGSSSILNITQTSWENFITPNCILTSHWDKMPTGRSIWWFLSKSSSKYQIDTPKDQFEWWFRKKCFEMWTVACVRNSLLLSWTPCSSQKSWNYISQSSRTADTPRLIQCSGGWSVGKSNWKM